MNWRHTPRMAGPLSLRKLAIVLKSGINRPVNHISSTLRWVPTTTVRRSYQVGARTPGPEWGGTAHPPRGQPYLFGPGGHHGADPACGLPFGVTANGRTHWLRHH